MKTLRRFCIYVFIYVCRISIFMFSFVLKRGIKLGGIPFSSFGGSARFECGWYFDSDRCSLSFQASPGQRTERVIWYAARDFPNKRTEPVSALHPYKTRKTLNGRRRRTRFPSENPKQIDDKTETCCTSSLCSNISERIPYFSYFFFYIRNMYTYNFPVPHH